MKAKGLHPGKLAAAVTLCLIAILLAAYIGERTFAPIQLPDRKEFRKFGPGGASGARSTPSRLPSGSQ